MKLLNLLQEAAEAAAKLEAGAPAKVLPTSCLACAYFHRGDFTKAFELFLKTMVSDDVSGSFGSSVE